MPDRYLSKLGQEDEEVVTEVEASTNLELREENNALKQKMALMEEKFEETEEWQKKTEEIIDKLLIKAGIPDGLRLKAAQQ